jgi:3,4-dihydroxy 2-butanone 4-phosphate synthase/GTP cyclohydrolase II
MSIMNKLNSIQEAIEDIKKGKFVIVVDDDQVDHNPKLVVAASQLTSEHFNFLVNHGRDMSKLAVTTDKFETLSNIKPDVNKEYNDQTLTLDYQGLTAGYTHDNRVKTIQHIINQNSAASEFKRDGHVLVTPTRIGGVLKCAAAKEAIVDLTRLAQLTPAGLVSGILDKYGVPLQPNQIQTYAKTHHLKVISIADLIAYKRKTEQLVERVAETKMPTKYGDFTMIGYVNTINAEHHIALITGDITTDEPVLMRVHSECLTGDSFGSLRCDCGEQLQSAMKRVQAEGRGIILYMRQEGRGIGLINKIKAYALQDQGMDTVEANIALGFPDDLRDYGIGAQMLVDLGVKKVKLMTNNPRKIKGLSGYGIEIITREAIQMNHNERNEKYLKTKRDKMEHILDFETSK